MKVYVDFRSGNCYKVQLTAALLDQPIEWVELDILSKQTRTTAFLQKNPVGKIPLLESDDGRYLSESNAIINHLSWGRYLLPNDAWQFGQVQQWQFFEQYSHEPNIAVARFIQLYLGLPPDKQQQHEEKLAGGHQALGVMEQHLAQSPYLVGHSITVADISLFAYTHVAHEGGFDLSAYPATLSWIERVKCHPKFIPMSS